MRAAGPPPQTPCRRPPAPARTPQQRMRLGELDSSWLPRHRRRATARAAVRRIARHAKRRAISAPSIGSASRLPPRSVPSAASHPALPPEPCTMLWSIRAVPPMLAISPPLSALSPQRITLLKLELEVHPALARAVPTGFPGGGRNRTSGRATMPLPVRARRRRPQVAKRHPTVHLPPGPAWNKP